MSRKFIHSQEKLLLPRLSYHNSVWLAPYGRLPDELGKKSFIDTTKPESVSHSTVRLSVFSNKHAHENLYDYFNMLHKIMATKSPQVQAKTLATGPPLSLMQFSFDFHHFHQQLL
jgi:hypothetical protein